MNEQTTPQVLVIDDDELSRELLELLLSDAGYRVASAGSGEEALDAVKRSRPAPDAVLMDMQLPGICGEELAQQLRCAYGGSTAVIAMSGSRLKQESSEAWDAFLLKPFSMAEFEAALSRLGVTPLGSAHESESQSSVPAGEQVLDATIFGGFEAMMGKAALSDLYDLCLSDARKQLDRMAEAAGSGDDAAFRASAHASKGSLGMLGACELQALCGRLEVVGLSEDHVAALGTFSAALQRLGDKLTAHGLHLGRNIQK